MRKFEFLKKKKNKRQNKEKWAKEFEKKTTTFVMNHAIKQICKDILEEKNI